MCWSGLVIEPFALSPCARGFAYGGVVSVHDREANTRSSTTMAGTRYDLEDRLINFAVQICLLTHRFPSTPVAKHVSAQITRSGTSPFANYGEAQAAESRQDFVHKLKICLKELRETQAWLKFADRMNLCPEHIEAARSECSELVAIFVASTRTATDKM